jgi:hypothetical protein
MTLFLLGGLPDEGHAIGPEPHHPFLIDGNKFPVVLLYFGCRLGPLDIVGHLPLDVI